MKKVLVVALFGILSTQAQAAMKICVADNTGSMDQILVNASAQKLSLQNLSDEGSPAKDFPLLTSKVVRSKDGHNYAQFDGGVLNDCRAVYQVDTRLFSAGTGKIKAVCESLVLIYSCADVRE